MKKLIALSAIGKDRPGIVAALSKVLFERGCNLEDSSMTRLLGDFAVLLLISLPEDLAPEALGMDLRAVAQNWGLTLNLRELGAEETRSGPGALPYTLVVYGVDHPGIVYKVAQAAAEHRANITDLRTHVTQGQGAPLYSLIVEVEIPDGTAAARFQERLTELKKELKVEVTLNPMEAEEL